MGKPQSLGLSRALLLRSGDPWGGRGLAGGELLTPGCSPIFLSPELQGKLPARPVDKTDSGTRTGPVQEGPCGAPKDPTSPCPGTRPSGRHWGFYDDVLGLEPRAAATARRREGEKCVPTGTEEITHPERGAGAGGGGGGGRGPASCPPHLVTRREGGQLLDLGGLVVAAPAAQQHLAAHPLLRLRGGAGPRHAAHHVVQVLQVLGGDGLVVVAVLGVGGDPSQQRGEGLRRAATDAPAPVRQHPGGSGGGSQTPPFFTSSGGRLSFKAASRGARQARRRGCGPPPPSESCRGRPPVSVNRVFRSAPPGRAGPLQGQPAKPKTRSGLCRKPADPWSKAKRWTGLRAGNISVRALIRCFSWRGHWTSCLGPRPRRPHPAVPPGSRCTARSADSPSSCGSRTAPPCPGCRTSS